MSVIGNFLWFILGGWLLGLLWWACGLLMIVLVITIPWAKACFIIGKFCFLPFGKEAISRKELTGESDIGTGALGLVGNILWFLLSGWMLALSHVFVGLFYFCTIIGIPFGIQHLKLAGVALAPVGKTIVTKEVAAAARRRNAERKVGALQSSDFADEAVENVDDDAPVVDQITAPEKA